MDEKTEFLIGNINETIYTIQLENLRNPSMGSSKHLDNGILSFIMWSYHSVFKWIWSMIAYTISFVELSIFFILYVDDILVAKSSIDLLHDNKRFLAKNFEMKDLSDAYFILGI